MTRPVWVAVALVAALALTLAGLAFTGMFRAVQTEMAPFFGSLSWIVPLGVDVGILALVSAGLLLEWLAMPMPVLRWIAMVFMGASVYLNVAAAHGSVTGSVGHAALPVLFIGCIEAARHAVRRCAGMAAGTVRDGIPLARWVLAPWPSFVMFRRMVLQRVYSYPDAVQMDLRRRRDIAALKAHFGAQAWRKGAPDDLVWMLRKGISLDEASARVAELTAPPKAERVPGSAPRKPARKPVSSARNRRPASAPVVPATSAPEEDAAAEVSTEAQALAILDAEPGISGSQLGLRLGKSDRYGRELIKRLAPVAPAGAEAKEASQ